MKRIGVFLLTFLLTAPLIWAAVAFGYYLVVEEWRLIRMSSLEGANAMGVLFMIAPICAVIAATLFGAVMAARTR
jgi:hypothetical protein